MMKKSEETEEPRGSIEGTTRLAKRGQADKIGVELAGTYATAYKLCREGYLAVLAPSVRWPEIDLIVHDVKRKRFRGVQIKTREKRPRSHYFAPSQPHPTVFVTLDPLEFYVHETKSVALMVREQEALPERRRGWIPRPQVEISDAKNNWDNIWK
jgi:hypothetical protein